MNYREMPSEILTEMPKEKSQYETGLHIIDKDPENPFKHNRTEPGFGAQESVEVAPVVPVLERGRFEGLTLVNLKGPVVDLLSKKNDRYQLLYLEAIEIIMRQSIKIIENIQDLERAEMLVHYLGEYISAETVESKTESAKMVSNIFTTLPQK